MNYLKNITLLGRTRPRDAMKTKVKREVRWEDKSTNPVNARASTSSSAKIRVLNHKDYKTWKVRIERIYAFSSITGLLTHGSCFRKTTGLLMARLKTEQG